MTKWQISPIADRCILHWACIAPRDDIYKNTARCSCTERCRKRRDHCSHVAPIITSIIAIDGVSCKNLTVKLYVVVCKTSCVTWTSIDKPSPVCRPVARRGLVEDLHKREKHKSLGRTRSFTSGLKRNPDRFCISIQF